MKRLIPLLTMAALALPVAAQAQHLKAAQALSSEWPSLTMAPSNPPGFIEYVVSNPKHYECQTSSGHCVCKPEPNGECKPWREGFQTITTYRTSEPFTYLNGKPFDTVVSQETTHWTEGIPQGSYLVAVAVPPGTYEAVLSSAYIWGNIDKWSMPLATAGPIAVG